MYNRKFYRLYRSVRLTGVWLFSHCHTAIRGHPFFLCKSRSWTTRGGWRTTQNHSTPHGVLPPYNRDRSPSNPWSGPERWRPSISLPYSSYPVYKYHRLWSLSRVSFFFLPETRGRSSFPFTLPYSWPGTDRKRETEGSWSLRDLVLTTISIKIYLLISRMVCLLPALVPELLFNAESPSYGRT